MSTLEHLERHADFEPASEHASQRGVSPGKRSLTAQLAQSQPAVAGSAGQTLPSQLRQPLERSYNVNLGGVRIHDDSPAAAAADTLDASAFTSGSDIYFGAGEYQPTSSAGAHLVAHEVAHTVQQGGVAAKLRPGVLSSVLSSTDHSEKEADAAADAALGARSFSISAAAGPSIQRKGKGKGEAQSSGNEHVGADPGTYNFIPTDDGEVVAPGEKGYSDLVLAGTDAAAGQKAGMFAKLRLKHVLPSTNFLDKQLKSRSKSKARYMGKVRGDGNVFATRPYFKGVYQKVANWCQSHMNTLEVDRAEEHEKAAGYNGWVSTANSYYESMLRLEGVTAMLGVKDPDKLIAALEKGLDEAALVSRRSRKAFTDGDPGSKRKVNVPKPDDSVTGECASVSVAAKKMNVAFLGFQQNLLTARKGSTNKEGDWARGKMQEIAQIKQFLANVGKTVDITYSVVSGAPTVLNKATTYVKHGEAALNTAKNRNQILAGGRETHNPTYLGSDAEGNMVVRNVQTGLDRPAGGGDTAPMADPFAGGGGGLPVSAEGVFKKIADFAYAKEVQKLTGVLDALAGRDLAIAGVKNAVELKRNAAGFRAALLEFAEKCSALHTRIVARRQAYLDLGIELDNFARGDKDSKKDGTAPGKDQEKFATIFLCVSAIREVQAVGKGALGGAPFTSSGFKSWAKGIESNRSSVPPRTDIKQFYMGKKEWKQLAKIYNGTLTFEKATGFIGGKFASVEAKAATVMANMDPATKGKPKMGAY